MKVQISTDYAIRVLQYLHLKELAGDPQQTAVAISQETGITYPFFIKIASLLKRANILAAVQGRNGGYALGRPASKITIHDVFLAIEGELQINRCFQHHAPCNNGPKKRCELRHFFTRIQDSIVQEMKSVSIQDLTPSQDTAHYETAV
ncbi:MAG: Rrf2 family transcriptional regulator [Oscillospiraceae bacterium]|nr:Rrf2 family transcriptional regulator [Oscillospiraceae bacterium]